MLREEAIKQLKDNRVLCINSETEPFAIAYDLAIKALEQEPTKNDLGVVCISREKAIDAFPDLLPNIGYNKKAITEILQKIPPVTLQEPRKGEWLRMSDLSEQEDDRYKCSFCGNVIHHKNKMNLYTFNSWCGRCGSDNGKHINYEVESREIE